MHVTEISSQLRTPALHRFDAAMTIEEALAERDVLDFGEDSSYIVIAKSYSVARLTLSRNRRGVSRSRADASLARRDLQSKREAEPGII
jgi:hypothetical protein